ncbi:transposase [Streptantibioticus rubrisoli]|uniref:Transposase n=1 Tax=Streptantibioticus rubrisoli TaxID=1387313 RepID=A0ABT1PD84_9ACTN|nr:transposase [Streptantibioticus rubrisoli]MCQ4043311.1 transposase [Streptantibioticus rubrisoli]
MALSQLDLMRLLQSLRRADAVETIRMLCERILHELSEAEATEAIGAVPGEHGEQRTTWRNGHRERLLTAKAGVHTNANPSTSSPSPASPAPSLICYRRLAK